MVVIGIKYSSSSLSPRRKRKFVPNVEKSSFFSLFASTIRVARVWIFIFRDSNKLKVRGSLKLSRF